MKETKHMSDIIYNVKNGKKNIIIKGRTGSGKTLLIHNLLPIIGRDCCVIEWIECINDINKLQSMLPEGTINIFTLQSKRFLEEIDFDYFLVELDKEVKDERIN